MNLFINYQKKISNSLKDLERKKVIKFSKLIKKFNIEVPPKGQKGDLSCNIALILASINKTSPMELANIIKKKLLDDIKEFETIEVAGPGFLNISFKITFWNKYLKQVIKMGSN